MENLMTEKKMDLRIQRTYMFLHNAFTELLEEKRFEDFTVNELCERAMIRRTTFYKHFADKYEYLTFYMKEIGASFHEQLPPDVLTDNINTYFIYMCRALIRFLAKHEMLVKNVANSNMFSLLLDSLSEIIVSDMLLALRQFNHQENMTPLQMEGTAAFYSGGMISTLYHWIKQNRAIDEEQIIGIFSIFLNQ